MIRLLLFVPALLGLKQSTDRNHISVLELEKTPTLPSTTAKRESDYSEKSHLSPR